MQSETVVVGKPDQVSTCITSPSRPFPVHSWIRAAVHLMRMTDVDFLTRLDAVAQCLLITELVAEQMAQIQRIEPVPGFTWLQ